MEQYGTFLGGNIEENYVFRVTMQCSRALQRIELVFGFEMLSALTWKIVESLEVLRNIETFEKVQKRSKVVFLVPRYSVGLYGGAGEECPKTFQHILKMISIIT